MGPFLGRPDRLAAGGYSAGVSVLGIVLRFTLCVLVLLAIVWVIREVLAELRRRHTVTPRPVSPALAELDMLYARGDVKRADYLARRADLAGVPPLPPTG